MSSEGAKRDPLVWLVAVLAFICGLALLRTLAVVGVHVSFDPNEGWNAYHAQAAINGGALYPAAGSFFVNNYPPISFYVVGALGRLVGDDIVAGRIVSLLSLLALIGLVATAAIRMGADRLSAAFAALFLAAYVLLATDYVGMDDPQMLAHVVQLGGLFLLGEPRRSWKVVAAALLFVVGGFIKHNLVALPLAATVFLFLYDRRDAYVLAAATIVFAVVGLIGFQLVSGINLLAHLESVRSWSFANVASALPAWLPWAGLPIVLVGPSAYFFRDDRSLVFCAIYAAFGIAFGVLLLSGAGVDVNALFDADIALALGLALVLHRTPSIERHSRIFVAAAVLVPFALFIGAMTSADWLDPSFWLMRYDAQTARPDIAFIRAHKGPALCETLALCYWAGKPATVDVFNISQQYAAGVRSDAGLAALIGERKFSTMQFESLTPFASAPGVLAAIARSYRIDHRDDDGVFFVPRQQK